MLLKALSAIQKCCHHRKAGHRSSRKGKRGIGLARLLKDITLLLAVDQTEADSFFHFHENPPLCPVGRNIHAALDEDLERAQKALEDQLASVHMDEVEGTIRKRIGRVA